MNVFRILGISDYVRFEINSTYFVHKVSVNVL